MLRLLRLCLGAWLIASAAAESAPRVAPTQLIRPNDFWKGWPITTQAPPESWASPAFVDDGWVTWRAGFSAGYIGYSQAATPLPRLWQGEAIRSLAVRRTFEIADLAAIRSLLLRVDFGDGLRVWLNGQEVARRGFDATNTLAWDAIPTLRTPLDAEVIDLTARVDLLRVGTNVLALQVTDGFPGSSTLYLWPELRANFQRGPWLQNVSTQQAWITWDTAVPATGWVEWEELAPAEPGETPVRSTRRVVAANPATRQAVPLDSLSPGTTYRYRVGVTLNGGDVEVAEADFTTLRPKGDVDFIVLGDTGSGLEGQSVILPALAAEKADLALHVGDIVYPSFTPGRVDLHCASFYEPVFRRLPFFYTYGNHDVYGGEAPYLDAFLLPTNSLTGTERYYSFDHGDVHFASLLVPWFGYSLLAQVLPDGSRSDQYRWLTNDLARSTKPWKVVFFHQPPKSSGPHGVDDYDVDGRPDVQQANEFFLPLLRDYGVQVVFNGHDHNWERFPPTNGVHFVVTGGGGGVLYDVYRREPTSARYLKAYHFTRVKVRGAEMRLEAVDAAGATLDAFTIRTRPPDSAVVEAPWHRPQVRRGGRVGPVNEDGNRPGEQFDFSGDGVAAVSGATANLGRFHASVDHEFLHLGFRQVMLSPGQTLALFVGVPGVSGIGRLDELASPAAPWFREVGLTFDGFQPRWVGWLGDERADGTFPEFARRGAGIPLGQGMFELSSGQPAVAGAVVRQFNASPELGPVPDEENADFIVVSLPRRLWSTPPGAAPVTNLWVAAVALTPTPGVAGPAFTLDSGFLGSALRPDVVGGWRLAPLEVRLASVPEDDPDGDGLRFDEELELGLDPNRADSDGDGLDDGWEVAVGLAGNSAVGDDGADGDPDEDGWTNREERLAGTDPLDPRERLRVRGAREGNALRLRWWAVPGHRYEIEAYEPGTLEFRPAGLVGFPRVAASVEESALVIPPSEEPRGRGRWYRVQDLGVAR